MFTGIVSGLGEITAVTPQPGQEDKADAGLRLTLHARNFLRDETRIGDSIAIQGACMTVVAMHEDRQGFVVDVSRESLNRTTGLDRCGPVNLEHAMRLGDTLDGHLVSGHVDGLGQVRRFAPVGESRELCIHVPAALAPYMARKGSVTVNGVSLTINRVDDDAQGCEISINLIPHTLAVTTLGRLAVGDAVNLEVDMIARYVARMLGAQRGDLC